MAVALEDVLWIIVEEEYLWAAEVVPEIPTMEQALPELMVEELFFSLLKTM